MWSNTDKWSTRKMWSNTDKGELERCAQLHRKMWSNTDKGQLERCDQIQIKVNEKDVIKYR